MTEKRFTVEEMQNWDKRFRIDKEDTTKIIDSSDGGEYWTVHGNEAYNLCIELNHLHEEKEYWKSNCCSQDNFNSILLHELDIAQEQGYEVSDPFKKLMEERRGLDD